jgi:hypothetical protein
VAGPGTSGRRPAAGRLVARAAIAVAGLGLAWLCLAQGLSSHFIDADRPDAALFWAPSNGQALALKAEALQRKGRMADAGAYALRAIRAEPLEAPGFRILANTAGVAGDMNRAEALYDRAGAVSRRDTQTQVWLFGRLAGRGDFAGAMRNADALMRRGVVEVVAPSAVSLTANPAAAQALVDRMAFAPDWRPKIFYALRTYAPEEGYRQVLLRMKAGGIPPTDEEIGGYINLLFLRSASGEAHQAWLDLTGVRTQAPAQWVYDPGFRGLKGGPPFNWLLSTEPGESVAPAEGGGELQVRYDGFDGHVGMARQMLVLPAGRYRLSGRMRASDMAADGLFQWQVRCLAGRTLVMSPPLEASPGTWKAFEEDFLVDGDCQGQWLFLNARAGERRTVVETAFTDLEIRPLGGQATP